MAEKQRGDETLAVDLIPSTDLWRFGVKSAVRSKVVATISL
jgi:hypothetical protein